MSLHDPKFKYRPSFNTDVGRHLRKFLREQRRADKARREQAAASQSGAPSNVASLSRRKS